MFRPQLGITHRKSLKHADIGRGDPPNTLIITHPGHPMGVNLRIAISG